MNKLTLAVTVMAAAVLGCTQKVTEIPGLDRVMTATEFNAQPPLRERVLRFCADDPGRYRADPNCVNAAQSIRLASAGNGNFPRVQPKLPAWAGNGTKEQ